MIKFSLDDLKSDKLEFGDKFYLPEREKRQNLRAGDIVKLYLDLKMMNLLRLSACGWS